MASETRAAAVQAGARLPQDHAAKAEAAGAPVTVTVPSDVTGGAPVTVIVPREIIDSYDAINAVYSGFTMPIMQALDEAGRDAIVEACRDGDGKTRASKVQAVLVSALTLAAQGE